MLKLIQESGLTEYELMRSSPIYWTVLAGLEILHPTKGFIPFKFYPHQIRFLADKSQKRIIVKSRQIGLSQVCALEALHTALWYPGSTVLFISRKEGLAANLLKYVKDILASVPPEHVGGRLVTDNTLEMAFPNGSRILSETAAPGTGRGFAGTALYMDEAAWMQYAEAMYQSALPMTSLGGRVTILSSPNGRTGVGGFFYQLWSSKMGEGYSKHRIPWYRCPAYNPLGYAIHDPNEAKRVGMQGEWYRSMRPAYSESQWASEYDADFILSGTAYFNDLYINKMSDGWQGLKLPEMGHRYIKSWDIGRRGDPTVCMVADVTEYARDGKTPAQVVYFHRQIGLPYEDIARLIEGVHDLYPGWTYIESNGIGDPVVEMVKRRQVNGYFTSQKGKRQALDALKLLMERQLFKCGVEQFLHECRIYEEDDEGLVQDCVMSGSILARQLVTPGAKGGWIIGSKMSST